MANWKMRHRNANKIPSDEWNSSYLFYKIYGEMKKKKKNKQKQGLCFDVQKRKKIHVKTNRKLEWYRVWIHGCKNTILLYAFVSGLSCVYTFHFKLYFILYHIVSNTSNDFPEFFTILAIYLILPYIFFFCSFSVYPSDPFMVDSFLMRIQRKYVYIAKK